VAVQTATLGLFHLDLRSVVAEGWLSPLTTCCCWNRSSWSLLPPFVLSLVQLPSEQIQTQTHRKLTQITTKKGNSSLLNYQAGKAHWEVRQGLQRAQGKGRGWIGESKLRKESNLILVAQSLDELSGPV